MRLVSDVEVQSGKCSAVGYSAPGLWSLLEWPRVRLADPTKHTKAISSRSLLSHRIGRQTQHADQIRITITTHNGQEKKIAQAYQRIIGFFAELKRIGKQTPLECWCRILGERSNNRLVLGA